jgi:predicted nucleic acid-binding protein
MPEMTIVNTSPLFYLHRLGLLEVLNKLYGNIVVPEAVKTELEAGRNQGEDVPQLENYAWINAKSVNMPEYLKLIADLGQGELEVLALATNYTSALVILDDKLARRIAEMQEFRLTGTAGVLLRAKRKGLIPALKPIMERLLNLDFRLKPDLVKAILELAGEE